MPPLTQENIKKHYGNAQYRKACVAYAVENIGTKDQAIMEIISCILEYYKESHEPITNAALALFNNTQPRILKLILAHNPGAQDAFVKKLIPKTTSISIGFFQTISYAAIAKLLGISIISRSQQSNAFRSMIGLYAMAKGKQNLASQDVSSMRL